jgi:chaperonin GroEL (HSP60 family)
LLGDVETGVARGFDAGSLDVVDMIQAGMIGPTKVERVTLQTGKPTESSLL